MAVRRTGGNLPNLQNQQNQRNDQKSDQKLDQKKSQFQYLRPQQLNTDAERRAAQARKHAAELDDEAVKHMHIDDEGQQVKREEEIEEHLRLKGINLDEERNKRGQRDSGEDEDHKEREEEAAKQLGQESGYGKYFEDLPEDQMGDPTLVNPNEIKRKLGPSARFAQHAMLIADQRMKEGMPREEALEFLCKLYLGLGDRSYARKALKSFGPATGILDLYPLEVTEKLLRDVPSFLPKISVGSFLTNTQKKGYEAKTGEVVHLTYPAELRIRGFAIKGGDKPGYLFEPTDPDGTYAVSFSSAGEFEVMVSAMNRTGHVVIEELSFKIEASEEDETGETRKALERFKSTIDSEEEEESPSKKHDDLKVVIPRYI